MCIVLQKPSLEGISETKKGCSNAALMFTTEGDITHFLRQVVP